VGDFRFSLFRKVFGFSGVFSFVFSRGDFLNFLSVLSVGSLRVLAESWQPMRNLFRIPVTITLVGRPLSLVKTE